MSTKSNSIVSTKKDLIYVHFNRASYLKFTYLHLAMFEFKCETNFQRRYQFLSVNTAIYIFVFLKWIFLEHQLYILGWRGRLYPGINKSIVCMYVHMWQWPFRFEPDINNIDKVVLLDWIWVIVVKLSDSIEPIDIFHNFLLQKYPLRYLNSCNLIGWKYKQFLFVKNSR